MIGKEDDEEEEEEEAEDEIKEEEDGGRRARVGVEPGMEPRRLLRPVISIHRTRTIYGNVTDLGKK